MIIEEFHIPFPIFEIVKLFTKLLQNLSKSRFLYLLHIPMSK